MQQMLSLLPQKSLQIHAEMAFCLANANAEDIQDASTAHVSEMWQAVAHDEQPECMYSSTCTNEGLFTTFFVDMQLHGQDAAIQLSAPQCHGL